MKETFGALNILVNNAGSNAPALIPAVDLKVWNEVFAINVTGVLMGIQACAPLMRDSGGGSIINIGSIGGMTGNFSTAYSSSKWALRGLSRSAAYNLADWGIRCNTIQPGFIETNMTKPMEGRPEFAQTMNDAVLLRRAGNAAEIATAALFLASDDSSYVTGVDLPVDGGFSMPGPYLVTERQTHLVETILKQLGGLTHTSEEPPGEHR